MAIQRIINKPNTKYPTTAAVARAPTMMVNFRSSHVTPKFIIFVLAWLGVLVPRVLGISVTSPSNNSNHTGNEVTLAAGSLAANAYRVDFEVDGEVFCTAKARDAWRCTYPARAYPDATHSVIAKEYDAAGALIGSASTAVSFRVQNAGGFITVTPDQAFSGNVSGTLTLTLAHSYPSNPTGAIGCTIDGDPAANQNSLRSNVHLSLTFVNAAISTANDTVTLPGHGLWTGQYARWQAITVGTAPQIGGSSVNSIQYYIATIDTNTIKFANSSTNAFTCADSGTNCLDITSAGSGGEWTFEYQSNRYIAEQFGISDSTITVNTRRMRNTTHLLRCWIQFSHTAGLAKSRTFADTAVNTTTGLVTQANHPLKSGRALTLTTTDTLPNGWALATTYYACWKDDSTWSIYTTQAAAEANHGTCTSGNLIPSDDGTGTHSWTADFDHPGYGGQNARDGFGFNYHMVDYQTTFTTANTNTLTDVLPRLYTAHGIVGGAVVDLEPIQTVDSEGDLASVSASLVDFKSNNTAVATVDADGDITCVAAGFAKIITTYLGFRNSTHVRCDTSSRFFHFPKQSGAILTSYDSNLSRWLRCATALTTSELSDTYSQAQFKVGGRNSRTEAARMGLNCMQAGLESTVGSATTSGSFSNSWNNISFPLIQQAFAATPFTIFCSGDNWYNQPAAHKILENTTWDRQAAAKEVMDDLNTVGGCVYITPKDEVDTSGGPDPNPDGRAGQTYFVSVQVSGCASVPCTATGTVTITGYTKWLDAGNTIRLKGASTTTALNRYAQIQTGISGGTFTIKTHDAPNATYDQTNEGANFELVFLPHSTAFNTCGGSWTGGTTLSNTAGTMTATRNGHGLATGMWLNIAGTAVEDQDIKDIWGPITVTGANDFTFAVPTSGNGAVDTGSHTGTNLTFKATCTPDINNDFYQRLRDELYRDTTDTDRRPILAPETVQGNPNGWVTPPFGEASTFNTTQTSRSLRNRTSLVESKIRRIEHPTFVNSLTTGRRVDLAYQLIVSWEDIEYTKKSAAGVCEYRPGVDGPLVFGEPLAAVSANVLGAVSMGYSGVKMYYYDDYVGSRATRCAADGSQTNTTPVQLHGGPFYHGGYPRGYAAARSLRLGGRFEKYLVSPNISSPHLGYWFVTGAKEKSGDGRLLIIANYNEQPMAVTVDLTPYKYGLTNQLYRVSGTRLAVESLADATSHSPTVGAGEALVYFFPATAAEQTLKTMTVGTGIAQWPAGYKSTLLHNYIYWDETGVTPVDCGTNASCSFTWDTQMTDLFILKRITDGSGVPKSESDATELN